MKRATLSSSLLGLAFAVSAAVGAVVPSSHALAQAAGTTATGEMGDGDRSNQMGTTHDGSHMGQKGKAAGKAGEDAGRASASAQIFTLSKGDLTQLITNAGTTYREMKGKYDFANASKQAECIAIFPSVTKGALIVGATHADGVASCKKSSGEWGPLAFVDFNAGSAGVQAGLVQSQMVMFMNSKEARQQLIDGDLQFGGDLSLVVGSREKTAGKKIGNNDITVFSNASGGFAGAALRGTQIKADQDEVEEFYEEEVQYTGLIMGNQDVEQGQSAREVILLF